MELNSVLKPPSVYQGPCGAAARGSAAGCWRGHVLHKHPQPPSASAGISSASSLSAGRGSEPGGLEAAGAAPRTPSGRTEDVVPPGARPRAAVRGARSKRGREVCPKRTQGQECNRFEQTAEQHLLPEPAGPRQRLSVTVYCTGYFSWGRRDTHTRVCAQHRATRDCQGLCPSPSPAGTAG